MKRRLFLTAAAGTGGATLAAPALAQGRVSLRVANVWSSTSDGRGAIARRVSERLAGLSGGTIALDVTPAADLGADALAADLRSGALDAVIGAEEIWSGLNPAFGLFTSCPGGMMERELEAWIRSGNGQAVWDGFAAGFGMKSFYLGDTGGEPLFSNDELASADAFSGKTIATRGLAVDVFRAAGATVQPIAAGQVSTGGADIAEPGPLADVLAQARPSYARLYLAAPTRPSSAVSLSMSLSGWERLDAGSQTLMTAAMEAESHIVAAEAMKRNAVASQLMALTGQTPRAPLPQISFDTAMAAARDVFDGLADRDGETARVVDAYREFAQAVEIWTRVSEAPFVTARLRGLRA